MVIACQNTNEFTEIRPFCTFQTYVQGLSLAHVAAAINSSLWLKDMSETVWNGPCKNPFEVSIATVISDAGTFDLIYKNCLKGSLHVLFASNSDNLESLPPHASKLAL